MRHLSHPVRAALCVLLVSLAACDDAKDTEETTAPAASAPATKASGASTASAVAEDWGPTVTIPAGNLKAGSRCMDIPRIRPDELLHEEMAMGSFEMDLYPYPNEPNKPAKIGVTWGEAKALCEKRGKRLCSELEWERACKGPKNTTFMWGDGFSTKHCKGQLDHVTGKRPECKTEFGVMDMMGVALEWTASDWHRGAKSHDKVVRGARAEQVSWLSARCTHSRKRDPDKSYDNVGFRCCSGEPNLPQVRLAQSKRSTLEEDFDITTELEMTLMKGMPKDHRGITGVKLSFDKLYRWHPVANEEMLVARWKGEPSDGDPFYEVAVFKLCGSRAWKTATMRGPVAQMGAPKVVGTNPRKLRVDVKTDDHAGSVTMAYWHGTVKLDEPDWVKKGNQLKVKSKGTPIRLPVLKTRKSLPVKRAD
ncbi:MAG: SUMF1/EgtB/PvdO family nonheme iron enzyme [Myxococcales bacterium]|nr:SUMF1/EgtB/PvdO family nonheme iron enzyme [Myxococcales bacterium]